MNPWGAVLALAATVLGGLLRDVLRDLRRNINHDPYSDIDRYTKVRDVLRGWSDSIDLPPFQLVVPPACFYDQDADGAA